MSRFSLARAELKVAPVAEPVAEGEAAPAAKPKRAPRRKKADAATEASLAAVKDIFGDRAHFDGQVDRQVPDVVGREVLEHAGILLLYWWVARCGTANDEAAFAKHIGALRAYYVEGGAGFEVTVASVPSDDAQPGTIASSTHQPTIAYAMPTV